MRALVLAGLLLCSLTSHAQGDPANDSFYKWVEEADDPSIKTSFGLAVVGVGGTAIPGLPGQEGPFGPQFKSDGLIGLGTIDLAIEAPFDARGRVTAGLGFFRGDAFVFGRDALFDQPPFVVMAGGFRDMLTVTGPGTSPGTVSAFARVGATSGDGVALFTYAASGALLDSDGFRSSGSAGSFRLKVEAPPAHRSCSSCSTSSSDPASRTGRAAAVGPFRPGGESARDVRRLATDGLKRRSSRGGRELCVCADPGAFDDRADARRAVCSSRALAGLECVLAEGRDDVGLEIWWPDGAVPTRLPVAPVSVSVSEDEPEPADGRTPATEPCRHGYPPHRA